MAIDRTHEMAANLRSIKTAAWVVVWLLIGSWVVGFACVAMINVAASSAMHSIERRLESDLSNQDTQFEPGYRYDTLR